MHESTPHCIITRTNENISAKPTLILITKSLCETEPLRIDDLSILNLYCFSSPPTSLNTPGNVLARVLHRAPMAFISSGRRCSHTRLGASVVGLELGLCVGNLDGLFVGFLEGYFEGMVVGDDDISSMSSS